MAVAPPSSWLPFACCLLFTFGLSLGLTYRSDDYCYAGTCGSHLFPLQARLHIVAWYVFLAFSVGFLVIRSRSTACRRFLQRPLRKRPIPIVGKKLVVGAALVILWVAILYGAVTAIWWLRLKDYFEERGIAGGVFEGNRRLAAIALTGHYCDITMGMAILPVSRHSALASRLSLSVATTLTFHMFAAYTLFVLVVIHGLLYVSWVPVYNSLNEALRMVYPVLNPTYTYNQTWPGDRSSLGVWRASLIFSGCVVGLIMLLIAITTIPPIRKSHFNLFYFTHLLGGVAIVLICLHASTMFYCLSPGLILYVFDWILRIRELREPLSSQIHHLGKGWYGLTVAFPRRRIRGYAKTSPLAHFYLHHAESSLRELHPFCAATSLIDEDPAIHPSELNIEVKFLFRTRGCTTTVPQTKSEPDIAETGLRALWGRRRRERPEWTNRLAGFATEKCVSQDSLTRIVETTSTQKPEIAVAPSGENVQLRLEGPYFSMAQPSCFDTVICIVAGTGVSGALAIAGAFRALDRPLHPTSPSYNSDQSSQSSGKLSEGDDSNSVAGSRPTPLWRRCIVVWTVREEHYIDLPELTGPALPGFELKLHLTGKGRDRLDVSAALDGILVPGSSTWVYISGPNEFISAGEEACRLRKDPGLECYGARWDI